MASQSNFPARFAGEHQAALAQPAGSRAATDDSIDPKPALVSHPHTRLYHAHFVHCVRRRLAFDDRLDLIELARTFHMTLVNLHCELVRERFEQRCAVAAALEQMRAV